MHCKCGVDAIDVDELTFDCNWLILRKAAALYIEVMCITQDNQAESMYYNQSVATHTT